MESCALKPFRHKEGALYEAYFYSCPHLPNTLLLPPIGKFLLVLLGSYEIFPRFCLFVCLFVCF